ncbi:MAG: hypothetical protein Kow0077_15080 [Anaerolineae bacterium]
MSQSPHNRRAGSRQPKRDKSLFYRRVMPVLFVVLALIMLALIVLAAGIATGLVAWT